jgi:hypothetical protein
MMLAVMLAAAMFSSTVYSTAIAIAGARSPAASASAKVTPAIGTPHTAFTLRFRASAQTGREGSIQRRDLVSGSAHRAGHGCAASFSVSAPDARAGARVRVVVRAPKPLGRWCPGVYHGTVQETERSVCLPGHMCADFVTLRAVIARFSFRVTRASSTNTQGTPPSFGGLQSAFACTPGAQRPGETTPFTLSWQPAGDASTPSAQIVYDVYLASAPGAENYATPTWMTPAGVTTFRTPGLASHGTFYFVVRARDGAGLEDGNSVERRGVDPCY